MRRLACTLICAGLLVTLCSPFALQGQAQEPPEGQPEALPTWVVEPVPPARPADIVIDTGFEVLPILGVEPQPVPDLALNPDDQTLFSFQQLGLPEKRLLGPFDGIEYIFTLPSYWVLAEGAELQLDLSSSIADAAGMLIPGQAYGLDGDLNISFDGTWLTAIQVEALLGEQTVVVPLPLNVVGPGNRHVISIWLDARYECLPEASWRTNFFISDTSRLLLPHRLVSPTTNVGLLPTPIYENTSFPEVAVIVVPDGPTAEQLGAAFVVSAAFGQKSSGDLVVSLVPEGLLTPDLRDNFHLVFVGEREDFLSLGEVPAAQVGQGLGGVLQMAVSPWNTARVVLLVTGGTVDEVLLAAQALAVGPVLAAGTPDLAILSTMPEAAGDEAYFEKSLAELDYPAVTLSNVGMNVAQLRFDIPFDREIVDTGYFDLLFNHSVPVTWMDSGITIRVNGQPVESFTFETVASDEALVRCQIPPSAVTAGQNVLTINAYIATWELNECVPATGEPSFVSILPGSKLHVPYADSTEQTSAFLDLANYPLPFAEGKTLMEDTAIVVPAGDPAAWNSACQVAFYVGSQADSGPVGLRCAFSDAVPEPVKRGRHLIVVGQPRDLLPLIGELADVMPAPIDLDSQQLWPQNDLEVDYYLPPAVSAGYLELMLSDRRPDRAILLVSGNSSAGVDSAAYALVATPAGSPLVGNLALISGGGIYSSRIYR